jgi:hypothetical protein
MTQPQTITIDPINPDEVGTRLALVEREASIPEDSAVALRGQFGEYYTNIVEWREKAAMVTKPEDRTHQKLAREVRLGLRSVRCDVENTRKKLKADSLARGKAIDGFANVLKYLCEPVEEKLLEVEQFAERQEAARIAQLVSDRTRALVAVEADPTAYNLGVMDDDTFALVLEAAKKRRADRIEAERKAEADRVAREQAEAAERERIRVENARLKKEAEEREAVAEAERKAAYEELMRIEGERAKERAEAEKARKAAEAKAQAERDAIEAKARTEREKAEADARKARQAAEAQARAEKAKAEARIKAEREKMEAVLNAERHAREKVEREAAEARRKEAERIAAEQLAESKRKAAEAEAARKAATAPDREKIMALAAAVRSLTIPHCATEAGRAACAIIDEQCGKFAAWIENQAEAL